MIARSDLFILVVSASLLAAGILRWQNNMSSMTLATGTAQGNPNSLAVNAAQNKRAPAVMGSTTGDNRAVTNVAASPAASGQNLQPQATDSRVVAAPSPTAQENSAAVSTATAPSSPENTGQANEPLYGVYVVQSGDFLGRIAQNYGTSVATLQQINGIEGSLIEIGQQIKYPLPAN